MASFQKLTSIELSEKAEALAIKFEIPKKEMQTFIENKVTVYKPYEWYIYLPMVLSAYYSIVKKIEKLFGKNARKCKCQ